MPETQSYCFSRLRKRTKFFFSSSLYIMIIIIHQLSLVVCIERAHTRMRGSFRHFHIFPFCVCHLYSRSFFFSISLPSIGQNSGWRIFIKFFRCFFILRMHRAGNRNVALSPRFFAAAFFGGLCLMECCQRLHMKYCKNKSVRITEFCRKRNNNKRRKRLRVETKQKLVSCLRAFRMHSAHTTHTYRQLLRSRRHESSGGRSKKTNWVKVLVCLI